jgi:hypothetical protein
VKVPFLCAGVLGLALISPARPAADPVVVRVPERPAHAPLVLRSLDGTLLANGNLIQTVGAGGVTSQVLFHFTDGSVHDETGVFSQNGMFRLLSYRLRQTGPSFRRTLDMAMSTETGRVTVRHREKDGEEQVEDTIFKLPSDVANGMMVPMLKNLSRSVVPATASWVAATPALRSVKLAISSDGVESGAIAATEQRRVIRYVVKAEIGGLAGLLAPLVGKQPPDTHVWILDGAVPAFLKSEGPLYVGGPVWRIEVP